MDIGQNGANLENAALHAVVDTNLGRENVLEKRTVEKTVKETTKIPNIVKQKKLVHVSSILSISIYLHKPT